MNYYLGIDIGTTSVKAVAFSEKGEVISSLSTTYPMQHTAPDRSEHNPDMILAAVISCINQQATGRLPALPGMLSFSSAMHSFLAVDEEGTPLTPCMLWADNRAGVIADQLRSSAEGRAFYHSTGVPVHAMTPFCKLIWLRQEEPEIFEKACTFMGIKEYVFRHLFGQRIVDSSIASATGLLNIRTLQWEGGLLGHLGIDHSKLSEVVPPRHWFKYDAGGADPSHRLNLPAGTPIVVGGSDGGLANLATGSTGHHVMTITIGTSGAARRMVSGPETDEAMRTFCYHVKDNCYILGGPTNNGAVVLQWLRETILETNESYEDLFRVAGTVPPGAEGLLFIPYILGERAPVWNSKAGGIYFNLLIHHTKAHMVRALMEGVAYSLYSIGKILLEKGSVRELHATGGFVRSSLWLQILADVFNIKVLEFGGADSSAFGAVIIGVEALGKDPVPARKALAMYEPDASRHAVYHKRFEQFGRIYELVKDEFNN